MPKMSAKWFQLNKSEYNSEQFVISTTKFLTQE